MHKLFAWCDKIMTIYGYNHLYIVESIICIPLLVDFLDIMLCRRRFCDLKLQLPIDRQIIFQKAERFNFAPMLERFSKERRLVVV